MPEASNSASVITVKDLVFEYAGKPALEDVSLEVKRGAITALVGPNGAGKTTLMRCIAGLSEPVSGSVTLNHIDVLENPRAAHEHLGYLSDFFGLYDELTIRQCLTYAAWSRKIPGEMVDRAVDWVIENLGLQEYETAKAGSLSRGWRQRLGIAQAMIHRPKVLILDEPASGLDPEARITLSALLRRLRDEEDMTLIVSSHILAELEDYCTDMLVIRDGKIVDHVHMDETQGDSETGDLVLKLDVIGANQSHADAIALMENIRLARVEGAFIFCNFAGTKNDLPDLIARLIKEDVPLAGLQIAPKSMQNAYMDIASKHDGQKTGDVS